MAQQISPKGTPLFMRVGNRNDSRAVGHFVRERRQPPRPTRARRPIRASATPSQVVQRPDEVCLDPGAPTTPASYAAIRGKKISDLVRAELADFKRQDMSAEDRRKVAVWESARQRRGRPCVTDACTQDLATRLGATSANLMPVSNISNMVTSDLDGADMYSVMAVLAAACNYNPVIFLKYPPNYVYSGIGISADSDNLSHRLDNAGLHGDLLPGRAQPAAKARHLLRDEVRQAGRHARRRPERRRVDAPRQQRRGLVPGLVGRLRPQPEQPSDHSGGQLRRHLQDRLDDQRRSGEPRGREPDPGQQRGAVRARRQRHWSTPSTRKREPIRSWPTVRSTNTSTT